MSGPPHVRGALAWATLLALAAALCACGAGDGASGTTGAPSLSARLAHMRPVRALRCARVARARLSVPGSAWHLSYIAQRDGAAVAIDLDADGRARVHDARGVRDVAGLGDVAARVAALVDASDLLCASEVPVVHVRALGDYRRSLTVATPGYRRTLSADMCYQPSDELAWREVAGALDALSATLVGGSTPAPAPAQSAAGVLATACRDRELARLGELDRRERALIAGGNTQN